MLFTSESVTPGHPDKVADQISDAVVDAVLAEDPEGRVACECTVKTGFVLLSGEITTSASIDHADVVRETIREIGYRGSTWGFDGDTCAVILALEEQSPDIALGVDARPGHELGAGDQGTMFGFACTDTEVLLPAPIEFAHRLTRGLVELQRSGEIDGLGPDGKAQVTVEYDDETNAPRRIHTVIVSTQHAEGVAHDRLVREVRERLIARRLPAELLDENTIIHINPTGRFVIGGPRGDAGLTGRKNIVDTYGGYARHGGGALSGKDPTKVDRSAAYTARWIAKTIVDAGIATHCEVQISYAIGIPEPVAFRVDTWGTGTHPDRAIERTARTLFPLTPARMIEELGLRRPIYRRLASGGHFGRHDLECPWESTLRATDLKRVLDDE
ncbi:MAG: methionine adenosyltransferase [Planctomycetes bacterium]|nr:methionine adenosyltransferase [Planctomycetota bacterium]